MCACIFSRDDISPMHKSGSGGPIREHASHRPTTGGSSGSRPSTRDYDKRTGVLLLPCHRSACSHARTSTCMRTKCRHTQSKVERGETRISPFLKSNPTQNTQPGTRRSTGPKNWRNLSTKKFSQRWRLRYCVRVCKHTQPNTIIGSTRVCNHTQTTHRNTHNTHRRMSEWQIHQADLQRRLSGF